MLQRFALLAFLGTACITAHVHAQAAPDTGYQPAPYGQGQYPQGQYPQQPAPYPPQQAPDGYYPGAGYPPDPNAPYGQPPALPPARSVDGMLQFGFGMSLIQLFSGSASIGTPAVDVSRSTFDWGLTKGPVVLEGGYGVMDRLLVGAVVQLGGETVTESIPAVPKAKISAFNLLLGPKVDFMLLPDSPLNPFVGAVVAIAVASTSTSGPLKESSTNFHFRARGGLRYFLFDQLSLDPTLFFGGMVGSGSQASAAGNADLSVSGFEFGITVGASVWIK